MLTRTLTLYLAGPMTKKPQFNFPAFYEGASTLRAAHYAVVSPHEQDDPAVQLLAWSSPDGDWSIFKDLPEGLIGADPLATAISNVSDVFYSDGVALLPGWEHSAGTKHEIETANRFGKPVATVAEWLARSEWAEMFGEDR